MGFIGLTKSVSLFSRKGLLGLLHETHSKHFGKTETNTCAKMPDLRSQIPFLSYVGLQNDVKSLPDSGCIFVHLQVKAGRKVENL